MTSLDEVTTAAAALVDAFSRHDTDAYFAAFAPDASFIFHNNDSIIRSRKEYQDLWASWETEGFRVLGCTSIGGIVQMLGDDVGVFTHQVRTVLADGDSSVETGERETIVFQRFGTTWLGVHEHLSVDPVF
jgi:ketosteroid isomerase-like protein